MPAARPLVMPRPVAAMARAKSRALSRPPAVGERLPTMATDGCQSRPGSPATNRPEEHTSEPQSLMSISYAVFCFNNKSQKHCNVTYLMIKLHDETHTYTISFLI